MRVRDDIVPAGRDRAARRAAAETAGRRPSPGRIRARPLILALVSASAAMSAAAALDCAHATIQEESCIEPDIEYPVPCED